MKTSTKASSFLIFLLYSLSVVGISSAVDTIYMTDIIRDGDTIISSADSFELGFFSPGNSTNRYVGIWYRMNITLTPVWVANREIPVRNTTSGVLTVNPSGQLVIRDESNNNTIWSTNTSRVAQNPVVQLLDSGNLVLREANDERPENYLWQSFDYPTDTFIPGMDFGWNLVTGWERYISSWTSADDPAPGDYTLHLDITGYPQIFSRRGDAVRSRIGPWNGVGFSGAPVTQSPRITAGLFMNSSVIYYRENANDRSVVSRITLSSSGVLRRWMWVNQSQEWRVYYNLLADTCDNYSSCGAHGSCNNEHFPVCGCLERFVPRDEESWATSDWSGGCVRRTPLNCTGDVFLRYSGIKMPDSRLTWFNESLNREECEAVCLRNCSCTAYSNLNISRGGSGCLLWFGDLVDIRQLSGDEQEIYIRLAASELDGRDSNGMKRTTLIAILTSVAGIVLLGLSFALFLWKRKKNDQKLRKEEVLEESNDKDLELPMYDLSTVTKATNSFSNYNKLGEGGFGPVYKGRLEDRNEIAVKRLSKTSSQGVDEFKNEVICIAKLQHRNLVKLLGCCIQGEEKMLIYEYMPNKSLDLYLFDETKGKQLDWPKRLHIINGIARGLLYLHQDSRLRIIHRDLKSSNILLDDELNPKISDFGMARIFGGNETQANTRRVVGTYGYMSPEYAVDGLFSLKSDVYSFGVVVLEIVSGHRNRGFHHKDHRHNLLGHAWILYKEGRSLELVDLNNVDSVHLHELERAIHVALLCVQQHPEDRPTMSLVVLMLGSEGILPEAKQPGFFTERHVLGSETSISTNATRSSNEYTITLLEAR
ncbi:g-type lectin s-receptor-like serine/threonine-protein kinase at4g27290 [Phtheirospermum japonicum]|uniref:Receptor-like serine/threonine-protein kinase n=1 Tax=Phtheirospermum japonicum TaxID=374723 RepID=A0A830C1N2_9LAMI|nr:g-type lectin s-receptor-like serine/threonine-protein kinase at4g27290 [Phtheirospermum japonicum]